MSTEELVGTMEEYAQDIDGILRDLDYAELVAIHTAAIQLAHAARQQVEQRLKRLEEMEVKQHG